MGIRLSPAVCTTDTINLAHRAVQKMASPVEHSPGPRTKEHDHGTSVVRSIAADRQGRWAREGHRPALRHPPRPEGIRQSVLRAVMKKRHELGLSPVPTGPSSDIPTAAVDPYEEGIRNAA